MNLFAFQGIGEVSRTIRRVSEHLREGCTGFSRSIKFRPRTIPAKVFWNAELGFWTHLRMLESRPWLAAGLDDPATNRRLLINLEFNPGFEESPLKFGGLFARDESGREFLCHTGLMGGGRAGLTKDGFMAAFADRTAEVRLPDGRKSAVAVVGMIEGDRFKQHFARFLHRAAAYKNGEAIPMDGAEPTLRFTPESSGRRRGYIAKRSDPICDHGLVVNSLQRLLQRRNCRVGNDRIPFACGKRDLFVLDESNRQTVLFEVKTECDLSSIYEGLGQLSFYCAGATPPPTRVLVLPAELRQVCNDRILLCGVAVLTYTWHSGRPEFLCVDALLNSVLSANA